MVASVTGVAFYQNATDLNLKMASYQGVNGSEAFYLLEVTAFSRTSLFTVPRLSWSPWKSTG